jgi:phage replication-related protein YjqB (UPF0714/DUF867 family)
VEGERSGDKYRNYDELRAQEREGIDFAICTNQRLAKAIVIAPHGGKIELATSAIAVAVAADAYGSYCFEGLKTRGNADLHITSTNFDEPRCLKLISRCDVVVAVHGLAGIQEFIDIGGRDAQLRNLIRANLREAGFQAHIVTSGPHAARSPRNICNRGRSRAGAQLEVTRRLRNALLESKARLRIFADAVRLAIDRRLAQ